MTHTGSALSERALKLQGIVEKYTGPNVDDEQLPQLSRLCKDFGLHVLPWREKTTSSDQVGAHGYNYRLATTTSELPSKMEDFQFLTPPFKSMVELETYVFDNMTDILHHYLFSEA